MQFILSIQFTVFCKLFILSKIFLSQCRWDILLEWSKKNFLNQGDGSYLDRVSKAFLAMPQELQVMINIVTSIVSRVRINTDAFDKTVSSLHSTSECYFRLNTSNWRTNTTLQSHIGKGLITKHRKNCESCQSQVT